MDSLVISFNAVMPMFLLILFGILLKKKKMVSQSNLTQMNEVVFCFFIPTLLFNNIYNAPLADVVQPDLILFSVISVLVIWGLAWGVVILTEKRSSKRGAMIQGIFRSNFTLFGLPIVGNLYSSSQIGVTSFMVAVIIPIFNLLASITLETFREGSEIDVKKIIKNTVTNPLMIGSVLGVIVLFLGVNLPVFLETAVHNVASTATPLALVLMGASLRGGSAKENGKPLFVTITGKLIIAPLLVIPIALLLGFTGVALATIIAIIASPTSISAYTMAANTDNDANLTAEIVVLTTIISCLTIFLWIFGLDHFGFL